MLKVEKSGHKFYSVLGTNDHVFRLLKPLSNVREKVFMRGRNLSFLILHVAGRFYKGRKNSWGEEISGCLGVVTGLTVVK